MGKSYWYLIHRVQTDWKNGYWQVPVQNMQIAQTAPISNNSHDLYWSQWRFNRTGKTEWWGITHSRELALDRQALTWGLQLYSRQRVPAPKWPRQGSAHDCTVLCSPASLLQSMMPLQQERAAAAPYNGSFLLQLWPVVSDSLDTANYGGCSLAFWTSF